MINKNRDKKRHRKRGGGDIKKLGFSLISLSNLFKCLENVLSNIFFNFRRVWLSTYLASEPYILCKTMTNIRKYLS